MRKCTIHVPSAAVAAALLLVGCSDSSVPTEPVDSRFTPTAVRQPYYASSTYSADGSEMSLTDETGMVYTLSLAESQVRRSDGVAFHMAPELLAEVASAFQTAIVNDQSIPQIENLVVELPSPANCDGTPGNYCAEFVSPDFGGVVDATPNHGAARRDPGQGRSDDSHKKRIIRMTRDVSDGPFMQRPNRGGIVAGGYSTLATWETFDKCTDIINAAFPNTFAYGAKRRGLFDSILGTTLSTLMGMGLDWAVKQQSVQDLVVFELPAHTLAVAGFASSVALAASEYTMAGVAIGWIGMNWNAYGCSSKQVTAGPFYHTEFAQLSKLNTWGYNYSCQNEVWTIEWSNGVKEKITVSVCDFAPKQT